MDLILHPLATYEYYPNNGKLKKVTYGNGFSEEYVYNSLEMLSEIWYNDGETRVKAYAYTYTSNGSLHRVDDLIEGRSTVYFYDDGGRFISSSEYDTDDMTYFNDYRVSYNRDGLISIATHGIDYLVGTDTATARIITTYGYSSDGLLTGEGKSGFGGSLSIGYTYDEFDRITATSRTSGSFINNVTYTYLSNGNNTSGRVSSYTSSAGYSNGQHVSEYTYTYDSRGNITKIVIGSKEIRYVYDYLGQLVREDNGQLNKTYTYTYDKAGNITAKNTYALTASGTAPTSPTATAMYTYGDTSWGDKLTAYNGRTITYDEIGNPLYYYNGGSSYTFTWEGRRLTRVSRNGVTNYTYNDEGIRTSKTVNGVTHTYYLNGSMILAEEWGNNLLVYLYDASGSPIGMCYRLKSYDQGKWDTYFFEKNLQGDIVAVFAVSGIRLATYVYDAWGNCTTSYFNGGATTAAQYNPFRYRGYYYDTETGFYYLQSRYYDPVVGRFISADSYVSTGQGLTGYNMFAYCGNNPVNYVDYTGESALGVVILLLLGAGALVVLTSCENPDVNNLKDTYGNVGDVIGFVDDSVQFGEDLQVYKSYEYSYSFAVSHYYQTNELYWDKHLEEAFSGDEERCLYLIEGDINLLKYNKNNKEHFNNINNVDYLYNHFDEWALYGRTGIVKQSAGNPLQSGTKWYEDIWGFVAGMFN